MLNPDGSTVAKTSDVPSVGSEQMYPIVGRSYGIPSTRDFEVAPPPDVDDEVCGTHPLGLIAQAEWKPDCFSLSEEVERMVGHE